MGQRAEESWEEEVLVALEIGARGLLDLDELHVRHVGGVHDLCK